MCTCVTEWTDTPALVLPGNGDEEAVKILADRGATIDVVDEVCYSCMRS